VISGFLRDTLEQSRKTGKKKGSHLKKWVKLGNLITLGKKGHPMKNGSHFEILLTLRKKSHLQKWVICGEMGHNWKNG